MINMLLDQPISSLAQFVIFAPRKWKSLIETIIHCVGEEDRNLSVRQIISQPEKLDKIIANVDFSAWFEQGKPEEEGELHERVVRCANCDHLIKFNIK